MFVPLMGSAERISPENLSAGGVICHARVKSLNDFKPLFVSYINLYKVNEE